MLARLRRSDSRSLSKTCVASQRERFIAWITVFGEQADEEERIDNIDDFVGKFYGQYEMFTDKNGRPCQASDDSLVAAMFRLMPKSLEETVMFTNEDERFQELFDRLLAYSSTKQSVKMSESRRQTRRDDPMDVDSLSKGKRKGKKGSSGSGKGNKGQNQMSDVVCWNCGKSGHYEKDC